MKLAKRFLTAGVALALTLGLNIPAFAATITVANPAADETYTAYKLFDVSSDGEGHYSYSTTNKELVTLLDAATTDANGFDVNFTSNATEDVWYVSTNLDSGLGDELAKYIHDNWSTISSTMGSGITAKSVGEGDGAKMQIDTGSDTGYYYVTSSLGSLCALNTVEDEATINEKNTVPSIDKAVKEDSTNSYGDSATVDTIDTIYYQLTVNTGTNAANLGTGIDGDYTIVDTLPNGVTFNTGTVVVNGWTEGNDYTVIEPSADNGNKLTITLKMAKLQTLDANKDIVITYNAKATTKLTPNQNYANTAVLTYKNQEDSDTATIVTYQIKGDAEGSKFTKVDGTTQQPLQGVKFALTNANGDYAAFDRDGYLTAWNDIERLDDNNNKLSTDANGHIYAYGLDAGTYTLIETDPLDGYNSLADTITVTIGEDGTVSYKYTTSEDDAGNTMTVENNAGSQLPTTGGMGTTVLYIAGAALVLGAGITLVVRRRMNSDQ